MTAQPLRAYPNYTRRTYTLAQTGSGVRGKINGRRFVLTNEFRAPKAGEFYLSGAIPEVYLSPVAQMSAFYIMREIHGCELAAAKVRP